MLIKRLTKANNLTALSMLKGLHKITYASGYVKYDILEDDFFIGNMKISKQTFGGVAKENNVFNSANYDGLVGFSYAALGVPPGITPIFNNVMTQKKLNKNVFSLFISRNGFNSSRFWLGGVNQQYIKQADPKNINWHTVIKKTWWTLKLDKVLIGKHDSGLCSSDRNASFNKNCAIIMDSGTSAMATPSGTFEAFNKIIYSHGKLDKISSWPDITFVIDGRHYVMPGYTYLMVNNKITYRQNDKAHDIIQPAFGQFDSGDLEYAVWIAGDSFLSEFITIYDRDNDKVGIAEPWHKNIKKIQENNKKI